MEATVYLDALGLIEAFKTAQLSGALALLERQGLTEASARAGAWLDQGALVRRVAPWVGRAACLRPARGGTLILYLAPGPGQVSSFPNSVVLDLEPGRYALRTWDLVLGAYTGNEVASASPLVCGPPCSGGPIVVEIERIG